MESYLIANLTIYFTMFIAAIVLIAFSDEDSIIGGIILLFISIIMFIATLNAIGFLTFNF